MSKFCTNCGQEIDENVNFCMNCGKNLKNKTNEKKDNNTPAKSFVAKSKIAAGLLGIFLGSFGVHNFYLGYTGKGITQLLISVLSFGSLSWISSIWGIVEGIKILIGTIDTDADGNPLSN